MEQRGREAPESCRFDPDAAHSLKYTAELKARRASG